MLSLEGNHAKEMPKKCKCAILSHAQFIANGTIGMNGSNAASLVEEGSHPEPET